MKNTIIFLSLLMNLTAAHGRSPAVDNFVGVEPSNYNATREPSSEKPYNFETKESVGDQSVTTFKAPSKKQSMMGVWGYVLFSIVLGAPFILWGLMMKTHTTNGEIIPLEPKKKDDIKKAS